MTLGINRCFLVTASAWGAKAVAIGANFFNLCILLNFLGTGSYAIAAVVLSLKGWFSLADFGIGISLQNYLSESLAQKKDIQELLRTACQLCFFSLLLLLTIVVILFGCFDSFFTADKIFSHYDISLLISISFIFLSIGSVAYKVFYAFQKGYLVHLFQMCVDLLGAGGIFYITRFYAGENKLFFSLLPLASLPALVAFTTFLIIFFQKISFSAFFSNFSWFWAKNILSRGFSFWLFSLMTVCVLFVDYLVASHTLSNNDIVHYNVLEKGFTAIFFGYSSFLMALHPQWTELFSKGLIDRMNLIVRKSCLVGCTLFPILCLLLFQGFSFLSSFFLKEKIIFELSTLLLISLYMMLRVISDTYSTAIQSMSKMNSFFILMPVQIVMNLTIQYFGTKHFGLNGIYFGLITSLLLTVAWGLPLEYYKLTKKYKTVA